MVIHEICLFVTSDYRFHFKLSNKKFLYRDAKVFLDEITNLKFQNISEVGPAIYSAPVFAVSHLANVGPTNKQTNEQTKERRSHCLFPE